MIRIYTYKTKRRRCSDTRWWYLDTIIQFAWSLLTFLYWCTQMEKDDSDPLSRYTKYFSELHRHQPRLWFLCYIYAFGCKNKKFRHFLARKSILSSFAWSKIKQVFPRSFCHFLFDLLDPLSIIKINSSSWFFGFSWKLCEKASIQDQPEVSNSIPLGFAPRWRYMCRDENKRILAVLKVCLVSLIAS